MKRIVVVIIIGVLFAVSAGCGGKSKSSNAAKSSTTSSTASGVTDTSPAVTGAPTATTAKPGTPAATTTTINATHTATGGTVPASKKVAPPAPGKYIYDNTGSGSAAPTTTGTVSPAEGARQKSVSETRAPNGDGNTTTTVLEYRDDGLYLVELRTDAKQSFASITIDFVPSTPVLFAPLPAHKGRTWSVDLTSTDGCYKAHADASVEDTGVVVQAAGGAQTTDQVRTLNKLQSTGKSGCGFAINLNQDQRTWFSEQYRLSVKETVKTTGTVSSDVTSVLRSTTPS